MRLTTGTTSGMAGSLGSAHTCGPLDQGPATMRGGTKVEWPTFAPPRQSLRQPMTRTPTARRRAFVTIAATMPIALAVVLMPYVADAQDADPLPNKSDSTTYANLFNGEFTPGTGFTLVKTQHGSLNISVYGLFRYMNQYAVGDAFTDHLGVVRPVNPRNDVNWQRTFAWLTGFFYDPKFRYNISLWSLPTTQQTLLFGNLQYRASPALVIGVGIGPNLTARSVQGSWPYWAATDRQMAEEFFRGGFSSSIWVSGQAVPRLYYTVAITNNISQLGVTQANDTPNLGYSASLRW